MSHSPAKQYYTSENARHSRHDNGNGDHYNRHQQNGNGTMTRDYHPNGEQMARSTYADRTYSLPRQAAQRPKQPSNNGGYYTQDRRARNGGGGGGAGGGGHHHAPQHQYASDHASPNGSSGIDTPDFYFMPSQRKYSGEVVRVYVDYNKDPKN